VISVRVSWSPAALNSLLDLVTNDCEGTLTTDHSASSRGLPVVVRDHDGAALGTAEVGELTVQIYPSLGHDPISIDQIAMVKAARSAGYVVRVPETTDAS